MNNTSTDNIYASPQAESITNIEFTPEVNLLKTEVFARISQIGLGALALIALVSTAVDLLSSQAFERGENPYYDANGDETFMLMATELSALTILILSILVIIFFCIWTKKSMTNAHLIEGQKYSSMMSPGWAVGFYFIPIAMLWKPYVAMKQMWNVSKFSNNTLLGCWWTCWIATNLMSKVTDKIEVETTEGFSRYAKTMLIEDAFYITAAVLLIIIIHKLTAAHRKLSKRRILS